MSSWVGGAAELCAALQLRGRCGRSGRVEGLKSWPCFQAGCLLFHGKGGAPGKECAEDQGQGFPRSA